MFPSEQLGSGKEFNEMIRQGANVTHITGPGYLSDFVRDFGVLSEPYLIKIRLLPSFTRWFATRLPL